MRHFEQEEIASRYAKYRPQVQAEIMKQIAEELSWTNKVATALDVACGTGHSTQALLPYAEQVMACDVSKEMLKQAKDFLPELSFFLSPAETLPVPNKSIDILSVSFSFHWFDQNTFLTEAARVLKQDGLLIIYNMFFTGAMLNNPEYQTWHKDIYQQRYATPKRKRVALSDLLKAQNYALSLAHTIALSQPLQLTALELRNYLSTQSNIAAALERGEQLSDIDACLDKALEPFFVQELASFEYLGQASIIKRV